MKLFRILFGVAILVLALGWAGRQYLLGPQAVPEESTYELDLARVRAVAAERPGPLPLRVNEELVVEASLPGAAVFAGESFDPHPMVHRAFQVLWEDRSLVIDAGMSQAMAEEMAEASGSEARFHPDAWERMQRGLESAESIVFTHEHEDHIDGVARGDTAALAGRVRFNAAQLANGAALDQVAMPAELRDTGRAIPDGRYVALAPGVVAIEAAGHTPGSQIFYVGLRDGREMLFLGDVAWHLRQIEQLSYRPRLVTDFLLGEDRQAVMGQFRTLHGMLDGPVALVVSHDADQRERLLAEGWLGPRFE